LTTGDAFYKELLFCKMQPMRWLTSKWKELNMCVA